MEGVGDTDQDQHLDLLEPLAYHGPSLETTYAFFDGRELGRRAKCFPTDSISAKGLEGGNTIRNGTRKKSLKDNLMAARGIRSIQLSTMDGKLPWAEPRDAPWHRSR